MRQLTHLPLCLVAAGILLIGSVAPATAQYRPRGQRAIGETYHVEGSVVWWNATPTLIISSEGLGIPGSDVDLVEDLGVEKKQIPDFRLVLRPADKHKFRFNYTPIKYEGEGQVNREFVFNGLRYRVGLPVNTTADLTTVRFGYEYDFLYRNMGYAGVLIDLKYTNVDVRLDSPLGPAFAQQVAPIPTIGFAGRGYVVPNVSITGEFSFFKIPKNLGKDEFGGRYVDFDLYGTVNFNENVGAQLGFRSIDVNYFSDLDTGDLTFRGLYFAGVVRF